MLLHSSHAVPLSVPARLRRLTLALAVLGLSALGRAASAGILTVPGQYATIQAAINASAGGDTVLISDGTYTGPGNVDVDFNGHNVTVTSVHGAASTVIDCGGFPSTDNSGDHRGFTLHSGETGAVIRGLTIKNGYESGKGSSDGRGGGIEDLGDPGNPADPTVKLTVQDCVLQNNAVLHGGAVGGDGGGLFNNGNVVTLTGCVLEGNTAEISGGGLESLGTATLTGCVLEGNTSQGGGGGLDNEGTATLTGCALEGNAGPFGGGLSNFDTATLTDCVLTGNTAGYEGGGLFNYPNSYYPGLVTLTNCTLEGNTAPAGGGLYNANGYAATLNSDTLEGNTAQQGGALYNGSGTVGVTDCIFTGDTAPSGSEVSSNVGTVTAMNCDIAGGLTPGIADGGGNLSADPLFINPATGDLHLSPGSPCAGAGVSETGVTADKDGTARPSPPSIGAYELGSTRPVPGQYATIQAAIVAANPGNTVLISDGTYTGPGDVDLDFLGKSLTVTSVHGAASTVIDCGGFPSTDNSGDHRGFTLHSGETGAVIRGLTIKNGYESGYESGNGLGGGIEIGGSVSVTVQGCVLQNDMAAYAGGGLFNSGTVTLTTDTVEGDTALLGGGLYNDNSNGGGTATLTGCVLSGDTAQNGGGGGLYNSGTVTLTGDTLTGDSAYQGGGLYNQNGGTVGLTDCVLSGDTAQNGGGGLYNYGTAALTNDTLTADTAVHGGGDSLYNGGTATLTNDILYDDTGGDLYNGGTASVTDCDVGGALGGGGLTGGGNFAAIPQFVSPSDLHLLTGSPCLGAGTASGAPATTIDGYLRPSPPSIGAYELDRRTVTAVALTSSLNPSQPGQSVTFTTTITGSSPMGAVTFTLDGAAQTPVTVDGNGNAALTTSALSVGSHQITAAYGGDTSNTASGSKTLTQTVNSATALTMRNAAGSIGQTVNLYAALATTGGTALPGQTITFSIDGTAVASGVTNNGGVRVTAYALPAALALGGHALTAAFSGDANNAPSSGTAALTVTLPATTLAVSAGVGTAGQSVTLRAGLHRVVGGAAVPGEAVTFSVDGSAVGTGVTNGAGQATLGYVLPAGEAAGGHPITVAFAGDGSYQGSTGKNTLAAKSATALSVAGVSGARGTGVSLSAVLTAGGAASPGKTVTFKVDGTAVGSAVTDGTGTAGLPYAIPAGAKVGHHAVSASFAGDAGDAPAGGVGTLTVR